MAYYLVDKVKGKTSANIVNEVKKILGVKKAGHSGTLDPFATGLLVIATGNNTRILSRLLDMDKTYSGELFFGQETDTLDIDGEIVSTKEVDIDLTELKNIINEKFIGEISQIPPKYSAIKVDGKRAYKLAREGKEFELKPVIRNVKSFEITKKEKNTFTFKVTVSSGTYIRSLARDIGKELDSPCMLTSLRRVSIGDIDISESNKLPTLSKVEIFDKVGLKQIEISEELFNTILQGKTVEINNDHNELIVKFKEDNIWITKQDTGFKIKKRL